LKVASIAKNSKFMLSTVQVWLENNSCDTREVMPDTNGFSLADEQTLASLEDGTNSIV
jgi:hypothetical protein